MKILICTPAYRGEVSSLYTASLMDAAEELRSRNIVVKYKTVSTSDLPWSRNWLASNALAVGFDYALMIDGDMKFKPRAALRLIACGHDVAGAVYPKRSVDFDTLLGNIEAADIGKPDRLRQKVLRAAGFAGAPLPHAKGDTLEITNGFTRFAYIGMGLALISTAALRRMIDSGAAVPRGERRGIPIFGFFDPVPGAAEDESFCRRWRGQCGGDVWAMVDEPIGHQGSHTLTGTWLEATVDQETAAAVERAVG
jgi:hypothetical protein